MVGARSLPAEPKAHEGHELFQSKGCVQCHYTDSRKTKVGPGLKGLSPRDRLPVSGREVTKENVRRQLKTPYGDMPLGRPPHSGKEGPIDRLSQEPLRIGPSLEARQGDRE